HHHQAGRRATPMGAEGGRARPALIDRLFREAYRFDFFQAVRLLEHLARERAGDDPAARRYPVGQDWLPGREVVRFRALPSLSFAPGAIRHLRAPEADGEAPANGAPPEMVVTFMGLTGPTGVLPQH